MKSRKKIFWSYPAGTEHRDYQGDGPLLCGQGFDKHSKGCKSGLSSVAQSCPTLCDPMDCSTPGFPVHHQLPELAQTHVHWVGDAVQPLILCGPFLLLPSIFSSIRVFSNELVLHVRWLKYWSFSFSISSSGKSGVAAVKAVSETATAKIDQKSTNPFSSSQVHKETTIPSVPCS